MESPAPPRARHPLNRPRRLRSRILLTAALALSFAVMFRGFGPYYLNFSPPECAGDRVLICTSHSVYRTLDHVLVMVMNRTSAAIVVERDHDTGSIVLVGEWLGPQGRWVPWALGISCPSCSQGGSGTAPGPNATVTPATRPQRDIMRIPPGGWLTGDYVPIFPQNSGRYRLVLPYGATTEALRATEDLLAGSLILRPEPASLPASATIADSAIFVLIDNGDRFPTPPMRS